MTMLTVSVTKMKITFFVKQVHGDAKKKKANLTKTQSKLLLPLFTKCIFEARISLDTVPWKSLSAFSVPE